MREPEDEEAALRWEGDEDLGRTTSLDRPVAAAPTGASAPRPRAVEPPVPRDPVRAVATGFFAVLLLAEAVGWILVIQRVQSLPAFATGSGVVALLGGIARFLALVAAPLWFLAAFRLTAGRAARVGWLALGSGLLVPWPLLVGLFA